MIDDPEAARWELAELETSNEWNRERAHKLGNDLSPLVSRVYELSHICKKAGIDLSDLEPLPQAPEVKL